VLRLKNENPKIKRLNYNFIVLSRQWRIKIKINVPNSLAYFVFPLLSSINIKFFWAIYV
jgi:hypothetical protein